MQRRKRCPILLLKVLVLEHTKKQTKHNPKHTVYEPCFLEAGLRTAGGRTDSPFSVAVNFPNYNIRKKVPS